MLDDLLELVLDLAVDVGGAAAKGKKKQGGQKTERTQKPAEKQAKKPVADPWDRPQKKPPWEK